MDRSLRHILDFIRKTGDRFIVADAQGDLYVVMDLDAYERLLFPNQASEPSIGSLSDETEKKEGLVEKGTRVWEAMQPAGERSATWDLSHLTPEERQEVKRVYESMKEMKAQGTVASPSRSSPPSAPGAGDVEDRGEEQFYLEPIE